MPINLLFVDDDPDFQLYIKHLLKKEVENGTYSLHCCDNSEQAINHLKSNEQNDIVFVDINLPGMNGLDLLSEINKLNQIVKVVMLTSSKKYEDIRSAMNREAFDFLIKPIKIDDLEITIAKTFQHIVALRHAREQLDLSYKKLKDALLQMIQSISTTLEIRDPYTAGYQRRVAMIAKAIAEIMNLDAFTIEGIYFAGLLHDIGKITVPSEILTKPGKLNDHEMTLIRDHVQAGFEIVKGIDFPWPIARVILQHHERIDGGGYPNKLKENEIMIEAKIIAVADTIEAVASFRPYRQGLGTRKALEVIEDGAGKIFDVDVVKAALKLYQQRYTFEITDL